ncbi:MAG: c-type cytochrome domain-containing protein, partial [Gemmataceae bacterium]
MITLLVALLPAADFTRDVKPILIEHCAGCHGPDKQRASLRVDSARALLEGGSSGPAVVPRKSADSLIIKSLLAAEDGDIKRMPPKGPRLSPAQINAVRAWIDAGASVPAGEAVVTAGRRKSDHWSFQPVARPALPGVKDAAWPRNGIDPFILARLEREAIRPSAEADPIT